jgi:hypothetical protein
MGEESVWAETSLIRIVVRSVPGVLIKVRTRRWVVFG